MGNDKKNQTDKYKNKIRKIEKKFNSIQIHVGWKIPMMRTNYVYLPTRIEKEKLKLSVRLCVSLQLRLARGEKTGLKQMIGFIVLPQCFYDRSTRKVSFYLSVLEHFLCTFHVQGHLPR